MASTTQRGGDARAVALSVVVPCYNEEQVLRTLYRRTRDACEALEPLGRGSDGNGGDDGGDGGDGGGWELVMVNDGSRDATWALMTALAAEDPRVVAVDLSRNHGHQLALTAGLSLARGRRVLVLDADLQDPPELLGELWRRLDDGADVAYGRRRSRAGEGRFKLATASLFYRLINALTDTPIPRDTGDFRLMSRRVADALAAMPERHRFVRGMVAWLGFRQEAVDYDRDPRLAGETKYPLRKMLRFATDAVTSFSTKPLRLATYLGSALAFVVTPLILGYALVSYLFFSIEPGWTSLICTLTLLGGVQLLVMGIHGEYLARLFEQGQGRPLYLIREVRAGPEPDRPGRPGRDGPADGRASAAGPA